MILAAGRGERMRPLTDVLPKPLLEVRGKTLLEWHLEKLVKAGFQEVIINIAHLGYKIPEYLGNSSKYGVKITCADEQDYGALESAGGIIKALPLLGEDTFMVINGDVFCDYEMDASFDIEEDLAHLILVPNPKHNADGDFSLNGSRVSSSSNNKKTFSGIAYYNPRMFKDRAYGRSALAPLLREKIANGKVSGSLHSGYWYDIGTPQRFEDINKEYS